MSESQAVCVLCKRDIDRFLAGRTTSRGHPAYQQQCPSCGWFVAEVLAISILDGAVKDEVRTREDIVRHFIQLISSENDAGRPGLITIDDAQAYCYGL